MRIVFMGTPEFSVAALESLVEAGHEVAAVVTQPDKAKGRGGKISFTPVKETALKYGIEVYQPVKVREREFVDRLKKIAPEAIVVAAFGQILTKDILDIPKYGSINIHASLLPRYRGAAPIQRAIIDGMEQSGVTTMFMDEGLDTGDMIDKMIVPIEKKETGGTLHDKLAAAGGKLIIKTLSDIESGNVSRERQDDSLSCYARMIDKKEGHIDFSKSAAEIERLIRGFNPWPSAYAFIDDNKIIKIWDADAADDDFGGVAGQIVKIDRKSIYIKTGKGSLIVNELQLSGKKRMSTEEFLRGYNIKEGVVLC